MKFLQKTLFLFLSVLLILVAHIFIINLFPYPYNHLNTVFGMLLFFLTIKPSRQIIWLAIILSYFLELLSGIPFGIGQASLIISLIAINWFQLNILTNRSAYIIFISTAIGMIFYRAIFFSFLVIYNYFGNNPLLPGKEVFSDIAWEVLLTSLEVAILYFIYSKFIRIFRKNFRISY